MFIAKKPDLKKKCRVDLWIVTNFILIETIGNYNFFVEENNIENICVLKEHIFENFPDNKKRPKILAVIKTKVYIFFAEFIVSAIAQISRNKLHI